MNKLRLSILGLCFLASSIFSISAFSQSFYDINTIQDIRIVFTQSNWDYLLDTAKAGSESYIMAQSVTINGVLYDSVGVKYKGNSTYNANQVKNPFHIELDTYKNQDYQGYTDIKMSNVAKDPSFLREVLSYSILRKYMDAPLSNYANVYVNGTLIGLYVSSESVSKKFVNNHFYSKSNTFIKCNPIDGAGPTTTNFPNLVYKGTDSASYYSAYEMKSTTGWNDLITLSNTLKNNIGNIESVIDVDRALWMLAFNNVLVNLDSYSGSFAQNYYLYKDGTGRFNPIMWDFNESFGTFSATGTIALANVTAKKQMTHLLHAGDANWPLIQQLLAIPMYKRMYLAHMQTILTENFANGSYLTTAQAILPIINASVQADPNKFYTYAQYQSNLTTDVTGSGGPGGGSTVPGITNLMGGRNTYLAALTDFTNSRPVITNVAPSNASPTVGSTVFFTANITNRNTVYLGYRYDVGKQFTRVLMYDDGAHGDGAAGDNVYGASIAVSSAFIQYYVYAENSNAGVFSPVRAEFEFYNLTATTVTSPVLMNEIYSRGTVAEPDWVELYNTSATAIDISGYKIYDAGAYGGTKPKKLFPTGTIIAPNGFVVIVVEDTDASSFGLSNSGEKVWLEDASGTVIDTITYLAHTAAQSYGRIPNGGTWQLLSTITKNASNTNGLPLSLLQFTAAYKEQKVFLQWSTSNEVNTKEFVVERSVDGTKWNTITTVKTNNLITINNYYATDAKPIAGVNYYRLQMVDIDGKFTFSNTLAVKVSFSLFNFDLYPNPATSKVFISFSEASFAASSVRVVDYLGKTVYSSQNPQLQSGIDVSNFAKGIYFVQVMDDNTKKIFIKKLVVQ